MSVSTPSQGTHFSDGVRTGPILGSSFTPGANVLTPSVMVSSPIDQLAPGVFNTPMSLLDFIPAPFSTSNIAAAQTPAVAGYLTLATTNSPGISIITFQGIANVIKLDCARNVWITGVGGTTSQNFTVFGWDQYGIPMVEEIEGPTNASLNIGIKTFSYIRAINVAGGTTANVSVGIGNTFGLPYLLTSGNYVFTVMWDGVIESIYSGFLNPSPLSTTNASKTIEVTVADTNSLIEGQLVTITGSSGFNGIPASLLNISAPITIIDGIHFSYESLGTATGGGAGGGTGVTFSSFVPGQQQVATIDTGDVRGTFTPSDVFNNGIRLFANGHSRLTINFYNGSGDSRNYNAASNGTLNLNTDPFYVDNTFGYVYVSAPNHQLTNGEIITISGAVTTHGITAAQLNISAPVTIIDQNLFSYISNGIATSTGEGGGNVVNITPALGNLYQSTVGRFGVSQFSRDLI